MPILHTNYSIKCLSCNTGYSNKLDKKFKKQFKNTFKSFNNDINKFVLLLRKGVYSRDYMDESENETTLPEEEDFQKILIMANNTDADYMHAKRFCENFEKEFGSKL